MKKLMIMMVATLVVGVAFVAHGAAAYWRDTYVRWMITGLQDNYYAQLVCYDYDTGDVLWAGGKVTGAVANRGDSGLRDLSGHTEPISGWIAGEDYFYVLVWDGDGNYLGRSTKCATYGFLAQVQSIYAIPGAEPYDFGPVKYEDRGGGGLGSIPEPTEGMLIMIALGAVALKRKVVAV